MQVNALLSPFSLLDVKTSRAPFLTLSLFLRYDGSGGKLDILPLFVKLYQRLFLSAALILGLTFHGEAAQIIGLESPNSFVGDPSGKEYFISNINGEPEARDNNGFITKLNAEGKITDLKFIQGGVAEVLLHAPKGMALVGPILYIADLDQLKAFNKTSGKLIATVLFPTSSHTPHTQVSLTD